MRTSKIADDQIIATLLNTREVVQFAQTEIDRLTSSSLDVASTSAAVLHQ